MQSASIILGRPCAGWLPVEINVNEYHLSFEASDLGLNVIDQLAEMVMKLDNSQNSNCYFYLEPGAYILDVEPLSSNAFLKIQFVDDFNHQDISRPEIQFQCEINLVDFHFSILNALRDFKHFNYEESDWPLPEKGNLLKQILGFRNSP